MATASRRFMGWFMLILFTGGCSTYRAASYPGMENAPSPETAGKELPAVTVGNKVRIVQTDGSQVEGRITEITSESLVLEIRVPNGQHLSIKNRDPRPESGTVPVPEPGFVTVQVNDIQSIKKRSGDGNKTFFLVVGIVVGTIGLLAVGFAAGGGMNSNTGFQ